MAAFVRFWPVTSARRALALHAPRSSPTAPPFCTERAPLRPAAASPSGSPPLIAQTPVSTASI